MAWASLAQARPSVPAAVRSLRRASSIMTGVLGLGYARLYVRPCAHSSYPSCHPSHQSLSSLWGHSIGIPMSQMKGLRLIGSPCPANTPSPPQTHCCGISIGGVQESSPDVFHAHEKHSTHLMRPDFFVKNKTMSL